MNLKAVHAFLGLTEYHQRFIQDNAKIVLLYATFRRTRWISSGERSNRMPLIDSGLQWPLLIYFVIWTLPCRLKFIRILADIRWVWFWFNLMKKIHERVIAYGSRRLSALEQNYSTTKREYSAILWMCDKYPFSPVRVQFESDHSMC